MFESIKSFFNFLPIFKSQRKTDCPNRLKGIDLGKSFDDNFVIKSLSLEDFGEIITKSLFDSIPEGAEEKLAKPQNLPLHFFPADTLKNATKLEPNTIHQDWHKEITSTPKYKDFKDKMVKGELSPELTNHIDKNFSKIIPTADNDFLEEPGVEPRPSNFNKYLKAHLDMPEMENWYKNVQSQVDEKRLQAALDKTNTNRKYPLTLEHMPKEEGEVKKVGKDVLTKNKRGNILLNGETMHIPLKSSYESEPANTPGIKDMMKEHGFDDANSFVNFLKHGSAANAIYKFNNGEQLGAEIEAPFMQQIFNKFKLPQEQINENYLDDPKLQAWHSGWQDKNKGANNDTRQVINSYDHDNNNDHTFKGATGQDMSKYKFDKEMENPFEDSLLYRYKHQNGNFLYTPSYYNEKGLQDEYKEPPTKGGGVTEQDDLFGKNKSNRLSELMPEEQNFNPKDFEEYEPGSLMNIGGLPMRVSGHDKKKGTMSFEHAYSGEVNDLLDKLKEQQSSQLTPGKETLPFEDVMNDLHSHLKENGLEEHALPLAKDKHRTIEDIKSFPGSYTKDEVALRKRMADVESKYGHQKDTTGLGFADPNTDYAKNMKSLTDKWKDIQGGKYHREAVEHFRKMIKHLPGDSTIDPDAYMSAYKQKKGLVDLLKSKDLPKDQYQPLRVKLSELSDSLEGMHPDFKDKESRMRQKGLKALTTKTGELRDWMSKLPKTELPLEYVKNMSEKKPLEGHSIEAMSGVESDALRKAGISPQFMKSMQKNRSIPASYTNLKKKGDELDNPQFPEEEEYHNLWKKSKSIRLHQIQGNQSIMSFDNLMKHGLKGDPNGLDLGNIRSAMGVGNDFEKKKLQHLLDYGVQEGLINKKYTGIDTTSGKSQKKYKYFISDKGAESINPKNPPEDILKEARESGKELGPHVEKKYKTAAKPSSNVAKWMKETLEKKRQEKPSQESQVRRDMAMRKYGNEFYAATLSDKEVAAEMRRLGIKAPKAKTKYIGKSIEFLSNIYKSVSGENEPNIPNPDSTEYAPEVDEHYNEQPYLNAPPDMRDYDDPHDKNHLTNLINSFRSDDREENISDFQDKLSGMDLATMMEYKTKLESYQTEFQNELMARNFDDESGTPYADGDFRTYMYLENLVDSQLQILNEKILETMLSQITKPKEEPAEV